MLGCVGDTVCVSLFLNILCPASHSRGHDLIRWRSAADREVDSLRAIRKPHDGDGSTATRYNPFAKKRAPSSVGQSNSAQGEGQRDGEQSSAGPESSSSPRSDRLAVSGRATLAAHRDDGAEAMYSATSDDDFRSPTDNDRRRKRRRRIDLWKVHPQWLERMRTSSPASERTVSSTGTSRKRYCSIPLGSQLRAIFLSS